MDKIDLQGKTAALAGTIESYWFENEHIGLINTMFHRITVPLAPFDFGLEYEQQPLETELVIEWLQGTSQNRRERVEDKAQRAQEPQCTWGT